MQDAHDGYAVRPRQIENEELLEILDPPFPQTSQPRISKREHRPDLPLLCERGERPVGSSEEAIRSLFAGILGEVDVMLYQISPRRGAARR
jgi:hypothetical protein